MDLSNVPADQLFAALPPTPANFAARYGDVAAHAGNQLGVDPKIILGQWGQETGWGKSIIPGTNNLGNIKAPNGNGVMATDNMTGSRDAYQKFKSPQDFANAYVHLVQTRYPNAVGAGSDVNAFTRGMSGYAQDRAYPVKVAAAAKSIPERILNAIIPSAQAQEAPSGPDLSKASEADLRAAAGLPATGDLSQMSEADLRAAAGLPPAAATPAQPPAPPMPLAQQLARQLGLTARAAGHGLADAAGVIGNPLNAAVNTVGGFFGHNPHLRDVDTLLKNAIDQYTPAPQGDLQKTVGGVAEQLANPINTIVPGGSGIAGRALAGAAAGAMQPVHAGTTAGQIAANAGVGALTGGTLGALGRVMEGARVTPAAQQLIDQGVELTPMQAMGGFLNKAEQKLSKTIPVVGESMEDARYAANFSANKAFGNQVLAPVGETVDKSAANSVRTLAANVHEKLSAKYQEVLPQITFKVDPQLAQDMAPIMQEVRNLPPDTQNEFMNIWQRNIGSQLNRGQMPGPVFKQADSVIGREAANFSNKPDAFQAKLGRLLGNTQDVLRDSVERTNPNVPSLAPLNQAWRNYAVLRDAASRVNNPDLPMMPGQIQAAVKAAAGRGAVGKAAFGEGRANMQDFSDNLVRVLGETVPNSGTAGRSALMKLPSTVAALTTLAMAGHPLPALLAGSGMGLGVGAYGTQIGRKAMMNLLINRPDLVRALGGISGLLAPQLGAASASGLDALLQPPPPKQ